jgi:uncharacterized protein YutE (UPF0331/DUF86 family)
MTKEKIISDISHLAVQHAAEEDCELDYYYELEAYELIAQWLLQEKIDTGNFAISELLDETSDLYDERFDYLSDLQLAAISEPPPFTIAPDMKELFIFHQQAFWPDTE